VPAPAAERDRPEAPTSEAEPARVPVKPAPVASAATSTAELLARANLARRQGRSGEALALYRTIVTGQPRSREAPLAHLALGKLLESAEPALALFHYGALGSGGGPLRAEGLWGQAECARRLGRKALEAQALEALVREFPASPYAEAARGRVPNGSP
jgi:Tfp pilus assembly protein PilF